VIHHPRVANIVTNVQPAVSVDQRPVEPGSYQLERVGDSPEEHGLDGVGGEGGWSDEATDPLEGAIAA